MEEIFELLIKNNLTPDQFMYLYYRNKGIQPAVINCSATYVQLLRKEDWITKEGILTAKSKSLILDIDLMTNKNFKKSLDKLLGEGYEARIKEFRECFPGGKISGKYVRVSEKVLLKKFRTFFKQYSYDWDVILLATRNYVKTELSNNEGRYMQQSNYFIEKNGSSNLATYCDAIIEGSNNDRKPLRSVNVV